MSPEPPDTDRLASDLIEPESVHEITNASRQPVEATVCSEPPIIRAGEDPWADFGRFMVLGYRLACYRPLRAPDHARMRLLAKAERANLVAWYDLTQTDHAISLQLTPRKLIRIPAETPYIAGFWVAVPAEKH